VAEIGDILSRPDGKRIRLAGVLGGEFVAEPLDDFGPPFRVTAAELVGAYGVADPTTPSEDSYPEVMCRADAAATAEANRAFGEAHPETRRARRRAEQLAKLGQTEQFPPAGSPEAVFAAEASDDDT